MNAASKALAQSSLNEHGLLGVLFLPKQLMIIMLGLAVFFSGIGVVYMKDLNRRLYHDLQIQQSQHQMLQTEWGQLLLEQSAWAQQNRIEQIATQNLQMVIPKQKDIIMVEN
jgi:cell division protein FtsL